MRVARQRTGSGCWTISPSPPGHDPTASFGTRAPASFKRVLNGEHIPEGEARRALHSLRKEGQETLVDELRLVEDERMSCAGNEGRDHVGHQRFGSPQSRAGIVDDFALSEQHQGRRLHLPQLVVGIHAREHAEVAPEMLVQQELFDHRCAVREGRAEH